MMAGFMARTGHFSLRFTEGGALSSLGDFVEVRDSWLHGLDRCRARAT